MCEFLRSGGVLFIITAAAALILAIGNAATKDIIASLDIQARSAAQTAVFDGVDGIDPASTKTYDILSDDTFVNGITGFEAADGKRYFAVEVTVAGYGGDIKMMVGVDESLTVTGISIIDKSGETPGLGSKIGEARFYGQFPGKTGDLAAVRSTPGGNQVQVVTGATISSRAVISGVNDAVLAVEGVLDR